MPPKLYHPQPTHAIPVSNMRVNTRYEPTAGFSGTSVPSVQAANPSAYLPNSATAQMGFQLGKNAVNAGQEYVEQNFGKWLSTTRLHHYFTVTNSYVVAKLLLIIFPWRRRSWARKLRRSEINGSAEGYCPPAEDLNSPDMYIPLMAFTTHILLLCALAGLQDDFQPELFGLRASKACAVVLVEFLATRLGCYLLNISSQSQVLDLLAFSGYKFVGLILTSLSKLFEMPWVTRFVFLYMYLATAFFLLRSLKYAVLPESTMAINATITSHQRSRRIYFLFFIAASQILFMYVLS
ncbi:Protein transport protein yif1 [Schizosaccharomyces pombe]|uniref:Protein transport protein yif1 n=1 Tax=Schizosaccharomyces pombe (strain 972 / ATCC 24843) TaxID=284812 RepID=YIF1_SCHPO|nr:putative COPII-coated vesicle-associated protein Hrf1 [Schizosaccharomyces pombe]P87148.1 RecName: Full=Protein transport protein yif1; AltName: Full=Heavy metal resistance factor 1; AltName: Full=YIP1-interacting factor 1 [Schizosaccharomyces pombe 972h-]CAB08782.1 COPII-coated vesicle component Hrf1 (predicted) [Schizosaccharomyces pombe]|eukprot:NP_596360.1 putative COPII-coated vesicle-associated protein Hrf1 [Schizosaccharomyces pombe]